MTFKWNEFPSEICQEEILLSESDTEVTGKILVKGNPYYTISTPDGTKKVHSSQVDPRAILRYCINRRNKTLQKTTPCEINLFASSRTDQLEPVIGESEIRQPYAMINEPEPATIAVKSVVRKRNTGNVSQEKVLIKKRNRGRTSLPTETEHVTLNRQICIDLPSFPKVDGILPEEDSSSVLYEIAETVKMLREGRRTPSEVKTTEEPPEPKPTLVIRKVKQNTVVRRSKRDYATPRIESARRIEGNIVFKLTYDGARESVFMSEEMLCEQFPELFLDFCTAKMVTHED